MMTELKASDCYECVAEVPTFTTKSFSIASAINSTDLLYRLLRAVVSVVHRALRAERWSIPHATSHRGAP